MLLITISELARLTSIIFLAIALCKFWSVFKEYGQVQHDKKSFYAHMVLVICYFMASVDITIEWAIIPAVGFKARSWLVVSMFTKAVTVANYTFMLMVAIEMWKHYLET